MQTKNAPLSTQKNHSFNLKNFTQNTTPKDKEKNNINTKSISNIELKNNIHKDKENKNINIKNKENKNINLKNKNKHTPNFCECGFAFSQKSAFNLQLFAKKEDTQKKKKYLPLVISLIIIIALAIASIPVISMVTKKDTKAFNSTTTTYVTVEEIWDSEAKRFNPANLNQLISYLSPTGTISGIDVTSDIDATAIRGYTYNNKTSEQSVVVKLGGLEWQVVFLTQSTSGDKVATLLLNNATDTSDWSANTYSKNNEYTANMYGTSYVRVVTLNNGGQYATGMLFKIPSLVEAVSQDASNKYHEFTMAQYGLTNYLVQPQYIGYQNTEQTYGYYNEAIGFDDGNYYTGDYYDAWKNDYIWLPSVSELGYSSSKTGIWNLSIDERANNSDFWTRSSAKKVASSTDSSGNVTRTTSYAFSYYMAKDGKSHSLEHVGDTRAVRPALHLNLESAVASLNPRVLVSSNNESEGTASSTGTYSEYGDPYFIKNTIVTLTATPNVGYSFDYWLINDEKITTNPYSFTITNDVTAVAYFRYYGADITSPDTSLNITSYRDVNEFINYTIIPTTENLYLYSIRVDTYEIQILKSQKSFLDYAGNFKLMWYSIESDGKTLILELLKLTGDTQIVLNYTTTNPNLPSIVSGVSNVAVTATYGGSVTLVGDNYEDLEDSETIICAATPCVKGYSFVGWYLSSDMNNPISTKLSVRLAKSVIFGQELVAKFEKTTSSNINDQTNNTDDIL